MKETKLWLGIDKKAVSMGNPKSTWAIIAKREPSLVDGLWCAPGRELLVIFNASRLPRASCGKLYELHPVKTKAKR